MRSGVSKPELNHEYPEPNEDALIREIRDKITEKMQKAFKDPSGKPARRDAHAKQHGCVWGSFIVDNAIPDELRFGIFREPGKRYTVCIRFSNGSGKAKQADSIGDARGMAIKLLSVDGDKLLTDERSTQDFVMINYPVFNIRNLQDYNEFVEALEKNPISFFFPGLNPLGWRFHEFTISLGLQGKLPFKGNKAMNPLDFQYWSMTPYRLGDRAIKFSVKPTKRNGTNAKFSRSDNFLREAMTDTLRSKEAGFDFLIQFQTDPVEMPIEDPTIEWKSPFHKVASIKIPPQRFDSQEQLTYCENLSYTPWHSLVEHRPLGGVNRARKEIYTATSSQRHELNQVSLREPKEEDARLFLESLNS